MVRKTLDFAYTHSQSRVEVQISTAQRATTRGRVVAGKCMALMALKDYLFDVRAVVTLNITVSSMLNS